MENDGHFGTLEVRTTVKASRKLLGSGKIMGKLCGHGTIIAIVPNITMDGPHQVSIDTTITSI